MEQKVADKIKKQVQRWYYDPLDFVEYGIGLARAAKTLPHYKVRDHQKDYFKHLRNIHRAKIKKSKGLKLNFAEQKVVDKFGISLRSGQGPGKTTVVAWTIIWYLITHKNALLPCLAPKAQQLKENVWKEVAVWLEFMEKWGHPYITKGQLQIQSDKIYNRRGGAQGKEKWAALLLSASQKSDSSQQGISIQGKHGRSMIQIVEEASGVPDELFEVVEGNMTDPENFSIIIFNPNRDRGYAYDTHHKLKKHWIAMHWNTLECDLPEAQMSKKRIQMENWGENDRRTRVRILGEFPQESDNAFITMQQVEDSFDETAKPSKDTLFVLGVDPAGAGRDKTVCWERRGHVYGPAYVYEGYDELHIANWILATYGHEKPETIMIDSNGLGGPVAARLRELGFHVTRVNPRKTARDKQEFGMTRDEFMWGLRKPFLNGEIKIRLNTPEHTLGRQKQTREELTDEILTLEYHLGANGRKQFITNDAMKAILGRSSDYLNALALAAYHQGRVQGTRKPEDHRYRPRRGATKDAWMC